MPSPERKLRSRFRGALLGCAVGDALGFPYQDYSRSFLRSLAGPLAASFARHGSGFYPLGQTSVDTQMVAATAEAIIEVGGIDAAIVAERLIPLWRDQLAVDPSPSCTEAMELLVRGKVGPEESGLPVGRIEAGAVPRAIPVALWDHAHPDDLAADIERVTSITHRDPRVAGAASAIAGALVHNLVAEDIILAKFLDAAAAAAGRFCGELAEAILDFPRILSQTEYRAFEIFGAISAASTGENPRSFDEGVADDALQVTLATLYYFLKSPFDFEKAIESASRSGGQVDTVAALTGALGGALLGSDSIPGPLASTVLGGDSIVDLADRLLERWKERRGPIEE